MKIPKKKSMCGSIQFGKQEMAVKDKSYQKYMEKKR